MGKQISINYQAVEEALNTLAASITALETKAVDFEGEKGLTTIHKILDINVKLASIAGEYQKLLEMNVSATREAIKSMKTTDEDIAQKVRKEHG
ncbi:DUF5344 family protein [Bacillus massilinigeriensis]|uniref:DUF5344 family protein n=1 Tax=Bacillus mediterraneensis TaxID=1805474 RepID=UPI0008F8DA8C|nr:DUF5344 family protein [Bacillus mediterraneensis]